MGAELECLEAALGHKFQDRTLLLRALTHRSRVFDAPDCTCDNEQLEFLGDSILGFLVSEFLLKYHSECREGQLSKLKAHLVSSEYLYRSSANLNLGDYLVLGRSEEMSGGRSKRGLLANAVEALIAALYLDAGMDVARGFVIRQLLAGAVSLPVDTSDTLAHSKTTLQEVAQKRKLPMPQYQIVREEGPHHARTFVVEARLGSDLVTEAQGLTKKSAEQRAAQLLLERLKDSEAV